MRRRLSDALAEDPLFFEPVPPPARASPSLADGRLAAVQALVRDVPRLDAINVPELADENHEGRPYYRTGDPRAYARQFGGPDGPERVVNKIVAHLDLPALERWVRETLEGGLHHLVLVGGSSRFIPYPGPSVTEATRLAGPMVAAVGGRVGSVAIPQRTGEAHRMLLKTRAGASFFTTQLVFDATAVKHLLVEYDQLCRRANLPPAAVLVSFAPLADEADLDFARWFGADIPEGAERSILEASEGNAGRGSTDRALEIWEEVRRALQDADGAVSLGVNVEQISARHLDHAADLLRGFARRLRPVRSGA